MSVHMHLQVRFSFEHQSSFSSPPGLDVRLLQPGGPGPMHPVASFNSKVPVVSW